MLTKALPAVAFMLLAPTIAAAQTGLPSLEVTLTKDGVSRLLVAIPELAAATRGTQATMLAIGGSDSMAEQDLEKVQEIIKKHGFELEDFALQVTALLHTYFTLDAKAFEEFLPSEKKPAIKKYLSDPGVSQTDKDKLRASIAATQKNKDELRQGFDALATPANKKVVKPLLSKVHAALAKAERATQDGAVAKKPS